MADNTLAQPMGKWTHVNGLDMRYLDWGGDGEPLLALHGLASSAHWYDIVARLLLHRYRIIAPDQRGHGQTTQAESGYDWHTLSDDLSALLDHVSAEIPGFARPVAALGHSWGGHVVSNFAYHHPDRVRRIVMIDGGFLDGRLFPEPTWEAFSDRLRPRNVTGDREEFLSRLREQMASFWNSEIERIVQTMVYEDEDGQIQDILRPPNQAPGHPRHVGRPLLPHLGAGAVPGPAGRRGPPARACQQRLCPAPTPDGERRRGRPAQWPRPLDPRDHPRHRLPQARGAGPK